MRKRGTQKKLKGLTLLETILYLALFAIIFVTVMQFVLAVAENNRVAMARSNIDKTAVFVMEHMTESFSDATGIDSGSSVFDSDSGVVVLNTPSGQVQYSVSNARIMYGTGGSSIPVSRTDVRVTKFYIEQVLDVSSSLVGVRLTMIITTEESEATETIETSFML